MQHTLVAVFNNNSDAQNALEALVSSGFSRADVRLSNSSSNESGATGIGSSAASDDSVGGKIKHFFSELFGDDSDDYVNRYAGAVNRGQNILTLTADSMPELERASDIVESFSPIDIDEHTDKSAMAGTTSAASMSHTANATSQQASASNLQQSASAAGSLERDSTTQSIPVVQEELKVGKREVQRGGVRIVSRIVETPVDESVALREEHVDVQRRRVDQPVGAGDKDLFREQSIEMRETAEEAVVQKSARVVEEISVSKQVTEREQQIQDTVRHTEVNVERLDSTGTNDSDSYYRTHYQNNLASTGASYDDYAPAYNYGSQMRTDSRYKGRQWNDIENDLRSDWDARNGSGGSTWEKMKAAVRHGWDRMTTDGDVGR